jgi:uncharacterized protein YggE
MRHTSILIISLVALVPALAAEPEIKGTPNDLMSYLKAVPKVVTVNAEGEAKSQADHAILSLRVVTDDRQLQDALRASHELRGKIAANLQRQGIETNRIKGAKFASTPKSGIFTEKARSYRVEHTVQITVRDEREFQAVANLVDTMPEVHFAGIQPELPDKEALQNKAISVALTNAAQKKALYEQSLQVKLTPRGFSELMVARVRESAAGALRSASFQGGSPPSASFPSEAPAQTAVLPELAAGFGEFSYTARLSVEYLVETK